MEYIITREDDELIHYGVKGMKWGVRRTPEQLGHKTRGVLSNGTYVLKKYTSPTIEEMKSIPKRIGVGVLASLIPGGYLLYNANIVRQNISSLDGKDYTKKEGQYEKLSELKRKDNPTNIDDDLKKTNPRLGNQKGKVNNCTFCSVALEMRQRGYDVRARSKAQGAVVEKLYSNMFENFKMQKVRIPRNQKESRKNYVNRSYNTLCNQIEKFGNGARGYIGVNWENANSGHAMYWKVDNNTVKFYDGQSGKKNLDRLFALADPRSYEYARLDNLNLKEGVTEAVISNERRGNKR